MAAKQEEQPIQVMEEAAAEEQKKKKKRNKKKKAGAADGADDGEDEGGEAEPRAEPAKLVDEPQAEGSKKKKKTEKEAPEKILAEGEPDGDGDGDDDGDEAEGTDKKKKKKKRGGAKAAPQKLLAALSQSRTTAAFDASRIGLQMTSHCRIQISPILLPNSSQMATTRLGKFRNMLAATLSAPPQLKNGNWRGSLVMIMTRLGWLLNATGRCASTFSLGSTLVCRWSKFVND